MPIACVASECIRAPHSCAMAEISFTGWMVPVSLLPVMTLTSSTSGPIRAFMSSSFTMPDASTGASSILYPFPLRYLTSSIMDGCSIVVVTMRLRPLPPSIRSRAILKTVLLDSLAPLVKYISSS